MRMKKPRPSRFAAALIALVSMLFMQLAVAGYACPQLEPILATTASIPAGHGDAAMWDDCMGQDVEQPNLCHAHATLGEQSLDKPELPPAQVFIAAALVKVLQGFEPERGVPPLPDSVPFLTRATEPPLSIQNCCFRI